VKTLTQRKIKINQSNGSKNDADSEKGTPSPNNDLLHIVSPTKNSF